ncbi:protein of unknown function [Burkholderia multivorans]
MQSRFARIGGTRLHPAGRECAGMRIPSNSARSRPGGRLHSAATCPQAGSGDQKQKCPHKAGIYCLAERTGLEPATPGVTGRYSNRLNYRSSLASLPGRRRLFPAGASIEHSNDAESGVP